MVLETENSDVSVTRENKSMVIFLAILLRSFYLSESNLDQEFNS